MRPEARGAHASRPPSLVLIAAMASNGIIGRDNALPWRLPADLAHFKQLTLDKPIIMGRRTWESLPGLLPRRRHVVITRDPRYRAAGCEVVRSPEEALAAVAGTPEAMVVGGAQVYAALLPEATGLALTLVHAEVDGDVRFPRVDSAQWREVERVHRPADERNAHAMDFVRFERAG